MKDCGFCMKKKLILVAAPPACGKTYVSERIAQAVPHIVYLDKDDLSDLVRASFAAAGQELNMDGDFYKENIRAAEYETLMKIAFSTLRFADYVLVNAPFGTEIRDTAYMKALKDKANKSGAELLLIWVTAPLGLCYERMKNRNSDRDSLKLKDWESYVKKINYDPPSALKSAEAVDRFLVFDNKDSNTLRQSLEEVLEMILGAEKG